MGWGWGRGLGIWAELTCWFLTVPSGSAPWTEGWEWWPPGKHPTFPKAVGARCESLSWQTRSRFPGVLDSLRSPGFHLKGRRQ